MLEKLSEYLPDEHRNQASLIELARSAQLRQQMNQLSSALMNGQLDLSHFGLASRVCPRFPEESTESAARQDAATALLLPVWNGKAVGEQDLDSAV